MIAGTRAEVAELNRLARERLIDQGVIDDALGVDVETKTRDGTLAWRRFAPGDRIVFTKNDRDLGVNNGTTGTVLAVEFADSPPIGPHFESGTAEETRPEQIMRLADGHDWGEAPSQRSQPFSSEPSATLVVQLDDQTTTPGKTGPIQVPSNFGWFDNAFCLTNHKSQGRTFSSAYILANPQMADREWSYVAMSRSRHATTLFVDTSTLRVFDPESHAKADPTPPRDVLIDQLAGRMQRSRAKGTTLDYSFPRIDPTPATNALLEPPRALLARTADRDGRDRASSLRPRRNAIDHTRLLIDRVRRLFARLNRQSDQPKHEPILSVGAKLGKLHPFAPDETLWAAASITGVRCRENASQLER